jgi:hypothetical protein
MSFEISGTERFSWTVVLVLVASRERVRVPTEVGGSPPLGTIR